MLWQRNGGLSTGLPASLIVEYRSLELQAQDINDAHSNSLKARAKIQELREREEQYLHLKRSFEAAVLSQNVGRIKTIKSQLQNVNRSSDELERVEREKDETEAKVVDAMMLILNAPRLGKYIIPLHCKAQEACLCCSY